MLDDIRKLEMKSFERAFRAYMLPFVRNAKDKEVTLKKDSSYTVFFEFTEENGVKTTRRFEEDLIFAYSIAREVMREMSNKGDSITVLETDDDYTIVKIRN